jgi:hypothetical protein
MEDVGIQFYCQLVYVTAVWSIFSRFGMLYQEKMWQPWT